ncbi:hypothetical protein [Spirosoma agri]|uniref:Uncharacterized protein n=1 Tax=Spirosoma agri TaxID=1987381 RepID=A0A6M0IIZ8_9BACT|nr:hypothetical protein [Spirosoma agri]NEU68260.1 hypothetical protein [Spirosoma agri]
MEIISYILVAVALAVCVFCERRIKRYQAEQKRLFDEQKREMTRLEANIDLLLNKLNSNVQLHQN